VFGEPFPPPPPVKHEDAELCQVVGLVFLSLVPYKAQQPGQAKIPRKVVAVFVPRRRRIRGVLACCPLAHRRDVLLLQTLCGRCSRRRSSPRLGRRPRKGGRSPTCSTGTLPGPPSPHPALASCEI